MTKKGGGVGPHFHHKIYKHVLSPNLNFAKSQWNWRRVQRSLGRGTKVVDISAAPLFHTYLIFHI